MHHSLSGVKSPPFGPSGDHKPTRKRETVEDTTVYEENDGRFVTRYGGFIETALPGDRVSREAPAGGVGTASLYRRELVAIGIKTPTDFKKALKSYDNRAST